MKLINQHGGLKMARTEMLIRINNSLNKLPDHALEMYLIELDGVCQLVLERSLRTEILSDDQIQADLKAPALSL